MRKDADHRPSRFVCLAGAPPHTGNLGVTALLYSVLGGLHRRLPDSGWTVFDYGRGVRHLRFDEGSSLYYCACGLFDTLRGYRPESIMRARLGMLCGGRFSPGLAELRNSAVLLDISGGDSFTDLYGRRRFRQVASIKQLAIDNGIPMVLLPQTYGPFADPAYRRSAERIVRAAVCCWARDERSYGILTDLAGSDFELARHHLGVDVAFALNARPIAGWSEHRSGSGPRVAINISGLIYNNPEAARSRFGFVACYRNAVLRITERLARDGAQVLLVPHVVTPPGHHESDNGAAEMLIGGLSDDVRTSVKIMPALSDPREVKWVISRSDWFCGTRMHATIAALSSGVPAAAISYSDKTLGVFETCGQGEHVHDPRELVTDELVERVVWSYRQRQTTRVSLAHQLPGVLARAQRQMDDIAATVDRARPLRIRGVT